MTYSLCIILLNISSLYYIATLGSPSLSWCHFFINPYYLSWVNYYYYYLFIYFISPIFCSSNWSNKCLLLLLLHFFFFPFFFYFSFFSLYFYFILLLFFFSSSVITALCESRPLPKLPSTLLCPATPVSRSSRPSSVDLSHLTQQAQLRFSHTSSVLRIKNRNFLQGPSSCILKSCPTTSRFYIFITFTISRLQNTVWSSLVYLITHIKLSLIRP
jgi:hypothetical protein